MDWVFGLDDGYGRLDNAAEVLHMEKLDYEGKVLNITLENIRFKQYLIFL